MADTATLSANRMVAEVCHTREKSRNFVPSAFVTVAEARLLFPFDGSSTSLTQVDPIGSTTSWPSSPFWSCLTLSAGERFAVPNSTGVATSLTKFAGPIAGPRAWERSPAYHTYCFSRPGGTVCAGLIPTFTPSDRVMSYSTSCGWSPACREVRMALLLKLRPPSGSSFARETTAGRLLKSGSSSVSNSRLRKVTRMQSPAAARRMTGSTGAPGLSFPVRGSRSEVWT
jgi:hypothetical protein